MGPQWRGFLAQIIGGPNPRKGLLSHDLSLNRIYQAILVILLLLLAYLYLRKLRFKLRKKL